MKTVLFCISETFPNGPAYASRTKAITDILLKNNYQVIILCDKIVNNYKETSNSVKVIEVITKKHSKFYNILKLPKKYEQVLDYILSNNKIDLIISRSMVDRFNRVLKLSKQYHIPLILESCEKYHYSNWKFGILNPRFWQFQLNWRFQYKKVDGVIAISRYIKDFYEKNNIHTYLLPAVKNINELQLINLISDDRVKLLFFGSLGNGKDLIKPIISTLIENTYLSSKIDVHLYGPSEKQVKKLFIKKIDLSRNSFIHIHNRINSSEFEQELIGYDYGLLLRPNRISSVAGFPTKLVDYLSFGIPVITNAIGDIKNYVVNGKNGFIMNSLNREAIESILISLINLDETTRIQMRINARESAEEYFSTNKYLEGLREFMDKVLKEKVNGKIK